MSFTVEDPWRRTVSGGALIGGDAAWAIRRGLPGLGRTPADDRLLALGFPQMVVLCDDEVVAQAPPHSWQPGVWPRALALGLTVAVDGDEELRARVASAAAESGRMPIYLLEALTTSERVARAAVAVLDGFGDEQVLFPPFLHQAVGFVTALHFLGLRVGDDTHDALLAALRRLKERMRPVQEIRFSTTYRYLELIVDGSRALAREPQISGAVELEKLMYAVDDPAFVRERSLAILPAIRPSDRARFDLRIAVIGGEPVMRALCAAVERFDASLRPGILAQLGRVRADLARPAIEALREMPSARRWLDEN